MKRIFTDASLFIAFLVFASFTLNAQEPTMIWSEDFSGGDVPAGWTNEDPSGNEAIFTWCGDPAAGQGNGCPAIWNTPVNQQTPFAATTADNGFLSMDSDAVGQIASNHQSELTTIAIDCSSADEVWLRMETHIGVFTENADANALLRVSTDLVNWTPFTIFPGLTTTERWSENPDLVVIDVSSVAANQSVVYVQWQWTGNFEYHWSIDDIALFDGDPRPDNDLRVTDFIGGAISRLTPFTQVNQFGFVADIQNIGSQPQSGMTLTVSIVEDGSGNEVYNETFEYEIAEILPDELVENRFFASEGFSPPSDPVPANATVSYTGTYTLTYDNDDDMPEDNVQTFNFAISNNVFAKDNGPNSNVTPAADNNFSFGNCFYIDNTTVELDGETVDIIAQNMTFGISNADELAGVPISTFMYKWDGDLNDDGTANVDEYELITFNFYTIEGTETDSQLITLPIDIDGNDVILEEDSYYFLAVTYEDNSGADQPCFLTCSRDYDYSAMNFRTDSLEAPRYGPFLDVGNTGDYSLVSFGLDIVPTIRLILNELTVPSSNAKEVLSDASTIEVRPNPTKDQVNFSIDLESQMNNVRVRILSATGSLINSWEYDNFQTANFEYDMRNYPSGTYYIHLSSDQGIKSERFILTK